MIDKNTNEIREWVKVLLKSQNTHLLFIVGPGGGGVL